MFRDPVCGMVLDENTAKFKITYEGETYHFCSLKCKKRFKRHACKFIKKATGASKKIGKERKILNADYSFSPRETSIITKPDAGLG